MRKVGANTYKNDDSKTQMNYNNSMTVQVRPRMPALQRFKGWVDGGWYFDFPEPIQSCGILLLLQQAQRYWQNTNASFDRQVRFSLSGTSSCSIDCARILKYSQVYLLGVEQLFADV